MQYTDEFLNVYRCESGSKQSYFDKKKICFDEKQWNFHKSTLSDLLPSRSAPVLNSLCAFKSY